MSIPQICPNCENHISAPHAPGCCYGAPEYAHLGWPNTNTPLNAASYGIGIDRLTSDGAGGYALTSVAYPNWVADTDRKFAGSTKVDPITMTSPAMEELSKDGFVDSQSAIRRLLAYLQDEPDEDPVAQPASDLSRIVCRLADRAEELRKEAAGMYNVEARAKRNFAADVLDALCEEIA